MITRRRPPAIVWLSGILGLVLASGFVVLMFAPFVPPMLQHTDPISGFIAVGTRDFTDTHPVQMEVKSGQDQKLRTPRSGRITAITCEDGQSISSGTLPFALDGIPVLALHTEVPLWRDLSEGDSGEDVRSLQAELIRLGFPVQVDGVLGRASIAAIRELSAHRSTGVHDVRLIDIAWLSQDALTINSCPALLGDWISSGETIASFESIGGTASAIDWPTKMVLGERVLVIDGTSFPISNEGRVTDLAAVSALRNQLTRQPPGAISIPATIELATPVIVGVVPPSSLYGLSAENACVMSEEGPQVVIPLTSELGETFITTSSGALPKSVLIAPEREQQCE